MPTNFDPLKDIWENEAQETNTPPSEGEKNDVIHQEAETNIINDSDILSALGEKEESVTQEEEPPVVPSPEKEIDIQEKKEPSNEKEAIDDNDILGSIMEDASAEEETNTTPSSEQRIIDINIEKLEDIYHSLLEGEYDFVTLEPSENDVKISFKKDKKEALTKFVKYPVYSDILIAFKKAIGLPVESVKSEAEAKGKTEIDGVAYDVVWKAVPSAAGEKIFIKLKVNTAKPKTAKKKTSMSQIIGFFTATIFVALVLWGAFLTFVVMNAQTVEDVQFFYSLGINLNDINTFISRLVTIIFSTLLFIVTSILAVFLFKFALTKKVYKRKRVLYGMASTITLIVTFATGSTWMIIDQKIKSLPNWQEIAFWDIQIFDNDRLTSEEFEKADALLTNTNNLIGPITLKYDLSIFAKNEQKGGFNIRKYIWNFGDEVIEEFTPVIIKTFTDKGNYEVSLTIEGSDATGKPLEKVVDNLPIVSIGYNVHIEEKTTTNGGKIISFDATELKDLGKIEWYMKNDDGITEKVWDGLTFKPSKIFFEEALVGLYINTPNKNSEAMDKTFVVGSKGSADIDGVIRTLQSLKDEREFELKVENPETSFGDGFIEEYEWIIGEKSIVKKADPTNLAESSKITYTFDSYGQHNVRVLLRDSSGKLKELTTTINIAKNITLKSPMRVFDNVELFEDIRYDQKNHEYFIDELGIPTTLKLDARLVKAENLIYSLKEVTWDFGNDKSIDGKGKTINYDVSTEWNHIVAVNYKFQHRKIPDDIINLKEFVYIEGIKKEALLNLKIEKETDYVPVTVRFDASKSFIKNDDIIKFVYDYGDGIKEERDAINPGHRYTEAGEYTVKLTAVGESGKSYSIEKKLILKPAPQETKIGVSLKRAPVWQGIDFSSEKSQGRIIEYFWNFWDGNTSIEANPTHAYSKAGIYTVSLRVDYENNNSLVDEMEIEIYEE